MARVRYNCTRVGIQIDEHPVIFSNLVPYQNIYRQWTNNYVLHNIVTLLKSLEKKNEKFVKLT